MANSLNHQPSLLCRSPYVTPSHSTSTISPVALVPPHPIAAITTVAVVVAVEDFEVHRDSRDLCLNLSTAFHASPILRLSYHPNDARSPFSLSLKMGASVLGSPVAAPMIMCAEFTPLARGGSSTPFFSIVFKPCLCDFSLKKIAQSGSGTPAHLSSAGLENRFHDGKMANGFGPKVTPVGGAHDLLSGTELHVSSVLPLQDWMALRFR